VQCGLHLKKLGDGIQNFQNATNSCLPPVSPRLRDLGGADRPGRAATKGQSAQGMGFGEILYARSARSGRMQLAMAYCPARRYPRRTVPRAICRRKEGGEHYRALFGDYAAVAWQRGRAHPWTAPDANWAAHSGRGAAKR